MAHNHSYKVTVKKLPKSQVEIESEIPADEFAAHVKDAIDEAVREVEIKGFRKGAAPEKLVREKLGMDTILHDAARSAISHAYGHIIEDQKIDAIGRPEITITKIAEGNPLGFKLVSAVLPEIKDFDYKAIARKENKKESPKIEVTDKEAEVKLQKEKEKRRLALIDALTAGVSIEVPDVLISAELDRMISEMKNNVSRMGLSWSDYLKQTNKTEEAVKKEWYEAAETRAKLDLAIDHIAKTEKISADPKKVSDEVKHIQEHHEDIDADRARSYFEHIYQNQAVFEFLEQEK